MKNKTMVTPYDGCNLLECMQSVISKVVDVQCVMMSLFAKSTHIYCESILQKSIVQIHLQTVNC